MLSPLMLIIGQIVSQGTMNVNLTRGLAGQSVARGYGNPNVVRQDKVVLGEGVAQALQQV